MKPFKLCLSAAAALLLVLAGCEGPQGPQGAAGINAGEGPFAFAIGEGAPQQVRGLSAFSAALAAALEEQPPGDSAENPLSLRVEGLDLGRKEELTALYGALTRYVALDLRGCAGTPASLAASIFRENREKIVSQLLPDTISLHERGPARSGYVS
jgi:hypothetical protein